MNPLNQLAESLTKGAEATPFKVDSTIDDLESRIYETDERPQDQREAYRYPAMLGQSVAVLRRRGHLCDAQLLEESAGGFRVAVSDEFRVQPEERIQVGVHSGWYEVRVAHVQLDDSTVILGLQRTGIVATSKPRRNNGENIVPPNTSTRFGWLVTLFMFTVVGIGAVACVSLLLTGGDPARLIKQPTPPADARLADVFRNDLPNDQITRIFSNLQSLADEDIAKQLALTPKQRTQIGRHLLTMSQRLSVAHDELHQSSPATWETSAERIVVEAVEGIVPLLTYEQLETWYALKANQPNA